MRISTLALLILLPLAVDAQNCKKGIKCGNTCIAANKTCRIGTAGGSSSTQPPPVTAAPPPAALATLPAYGGFDPFKQPTLGVDDSVSDFHARGLRCGEQDAVRYQSCAMLAYPIGGVAAEVYYGLLDGRAVRFRMRFRTDQFSAIVAALTLKLGTPASGAGPASQVMVWPFPNGQLIVKSDDGTHARWGDAILDRRK